MSETTLTYEASVFTRTVKYTNFKGETKEVELFFALDPLQLLSVISTFKPKKVKSANPARQGEVEPLSDEQQVKFVRDLCIKAAGFPSDDGESWEPFEDFDSSLAGKTFLTKLTSSDADRKEFSEKVILDPFRSFVDFAASDPTNSPKEIQSFKTMLAQMENLFKEDAKPDETMEERRARLEKDLAELNKTDADES